MIAEVAVVYGRVMVQFLAELYIFYAIIMFRLGRAPRFWLKVFAGLAAVFAIAFGVAFFYYFYGGTVYGRIAVYVFLFALTTAHAKLCFDEPYKTVLFCCSLAYAAQNAVYKLFLLFWCGGEQLRLFDGWTDAAEFSLYYRLIYYSFFILATAAAYFLLIRRQIRRLSDSNINVRMMAIAVSVLLVTIILCSFEDVHFAALSSVRENRYDNFDVFVLRQTGNFFSVVCCAVVLLLTSQTLVDRDLRREVEYLQYTVRQGEKQYEISKDTIDMINIKCHDIKYKVNSLLSQGTALSAEAAEDLKKSISIYDTRANTGNKILDVLLTEKSLYCEQNGITFSCMADGAKLDFMAEGDLYCLFGNIIDNALEAVNAIDERERRVVNFVVKSKNDMLVVQTENYFAGELTFKDGLPQTTKGDKNYHGFGMRSIRTIVNKYGGALSAKAEDGVFYLNIIFSPEKRKKVAE